MRTMKIAMLVVMLTAALAVSRSHFNLVPRARADRGCSVRTLNGTYGGVWTGLLNPGTTPTSPQPITTFLPYDGMEVSTWDGAGTFSASDVFAIGGTPAQPANDSGTYTVNTNCTGTLTLTNGLTFNFVIVQSGNEIKFAETDGNPTVVTETRMDVHE